MNKKFATALLASALFPVAAYAQGTTTTPSTTTPPAATGSATSGSMGSTSTGTAAPAAGAMGTSSASATGDGPFVVVPPTGAWRTSDLDGKSVEDANGESIGSISDTLVNEDGEVIAVLVGVGGFLGIGAKDVAVSMDALEFGPGATEGLAPAASAAAAPAGGAMTSTATTGAAAPASGDAAVTPPVVGEDNLPDRIVLNVTREELEAAPAYGEPEDAADDAAATGAATTGGMAPAGGATTGGMAPAGGTAPAQ